MVRTDGLRHQNLLHKQGRQPATNPGDTPSHVKVAPSTRAGTTIAAPVKSLRELTLSYSRSPSSTGVEASEVDDATAEVCLYMHTVNIWIDG
jgi:hypothetical protein